MSDKRHIGCSQHLKTLFSELSSWKTSTKYKLVSSSSLCRRVTIHIDEIVSLREDLWLFFMLCRPSRLKKRRACIFFFRVSSIWAFSKVIVSCLSSSFTMWEDSIVSTSPSFWAPISIFPSPCLFSSSFFWIKQNFLRIQVILEQMTQIAPHSAKSIHDKMESSRREKRWAEYFGD